MSEFYISIQQPPDDSFGKSLISLLSFLQELYTVGSGDNLIVNLDSISFAYPFLILPLASQINKLKEQGVYVEVKYESSRCKEYLQIIDFPAGLNPVNEPITGSRNLKPTTIKHLFQFAYFLQEWVNH